MTTTPVIDVSNNNTLTQLKGALETGVGFVIAKATEGQHGVDADHLAFVATARQAKAHVGHYHFGWFGQDPIVEADHFLAVSAAKPGDVVALDAEPERRKDGSVDPLQWPADVNVRLRYVLAWLAHVKAKTKASPWLYANISELTNLTAAAKRAGKLDELTSYPLWIAAPSYAAGKPPLLGWKTWTCHQYGDSGGVDRNVLNGGAAVWAALAVPGAQPVHVEDTPTPAKPTVKPLEELMTVLLYARRGTPDHTAAMAWADASGTGAVTCELGLAKTAAAAGSHVIAVGGPACDDLAGINGVQHVNGSTALVTLQQLAAVKP